MFRQGTPRSEHQIARSLARRDHQCKFDLVLHSCQWHGHFPLHLVGVGNVLQHHALGVEE
jgi:hypothetical protein